MIKAVFDTVVFVRSLINPHGMWGKLIFNYFRSYTLIISKPLITELLEVLKRKELTAKFPVLGNLDMSDVIDILGKARIVEIENIPRVSRDRDDDKFLQTAVIAGADYLVTEDKDLLVLKKYKGVKIVDAKSFLEVLKKFGD